jgi:tetratricopeptide (TPR) repeat protein
LRGVKVIARSSAFKYKGKNADLNEVAKALGVEAVLTGRVTQRGDNLSISVELMKASDQTQIWGEQYDRNAADVLKVQSEISRAISQRLSSRFTSSEQQQLANRTGINPQAYELLLRGRFYWRKQGVENQKKAIECFEQSIRTDPTYALAYSELSASYNVLYSSGLLNPKDFKPKAEAAVYKALELDEGLADAHYALAGLKQNDWQWTAAEHEYRRALELNPNLAEAYRFYSFLLMATGRSDEAVEAAKRARELDPLSLATTAHVVTCLNVARRHDEAMELSQKTLEMDQNFAGAHYGLAFSYAGKGMYRQAVNEYQEAIKLSGDSPTDQIYLGAFYAKSGERKKAQEILGRLERTTEYVSPGELAVLYAALGERDHAFASLERAYTAHDLQLQYLGADPQFDSLREDPRFKDLMRRVGLL